MAGAPRDKLDAVSHLPETPFVQRLSAAVAVSAATTPASKTATASFIDKDFCVFTFSLLERNGNNDRFPAEHRFWVRLC